MKAILERLLRPQLILLYILAFSFLVRLAGINYGLPLWLIDDEPPFTLAALKMIQLKTLIPAFHLDEFRAFLYYPPYLSYLYLLPFSLLLVIKYVFFNGGLEQFLYYVSGDLSQFFLIARFFNVLFGTLSAWLLYKVAENIFKNKYIALLSAFFLSTSLFHILMSVTGRHWLPVSFLFILGLYFLTNENLSYSKRFLCAMIVAGIGTGVSIIVVLLTIFILYWYLFYENEPVVVLLRDKTFYLACFIFIVLAALPAVIYPGSFGFSGDITTESAKTISGILQSPFLFLKPIAVSEPIFMLFAVIGLIMTLLYKRRLFWPVFLFIYTYSAIFYLFFRYEHRFTISLFPLLAILAAYGFYECYRRINIRIISAGFMIILIIPLILSLRLGYLFYKDDSRIHAREWIENNIPQGSRVLVYARLTRLSSTQEAIGEQEKIDPGSLRRVDIAEENLASGRPGSFHALNFYSISSPEFYEDIKNYAMLNKYQYLMMQMDNFNKSQEQWDQIYGVASGGRELVSFGGAPEEYSLFIGQLTGNPLYLFKLKELGPKIVIYKLY